MRAVPLFGGALWLMIAGAAAAETASPAVVSRDDAEVRAGPNENPQLYVTNRLKRGSPVQVVEEVGNGWLKIQPPAGSFSWISTNAVQQISPNQPNWMVVAHPDVRVPVIVGTDFPKEVASQIQGCRLARGAQVKCLGPAHMDEEGLWLRIEPPPGEYRFIRVDAVTRSDGSSIVRAAVPAARSAPSPVPPGAPPTEAETLWQHAADAERAGNAAVAIDLYNRAAAAAQPNNPELALQATNRAHWLGQASAAIHSTFTPTSLTGNVGLGATPNVQLAGPVGVYTTTPPGLSPPAASATLTGRLRRAGRCLEGCATYALDSPLNGRPLLYAIPQPGVDLESYINRNVELFGASLYSGDLRANIMHVERVQPVP